MAVTYGGAAAFGTCDFHRVKVAPWGGVDGKEIISRRSRQNRHNRRHLQPICYQNFNV
jgi:hypothetical protein